MMSNADIASVIKHLDRIEEIVKDNDFVKVVRCKDCKHLYKDSECPLRTWFTHDDNDYCSYGERNEVLK